MSAAVGPIPPHRFAEAIQDLPIGNLYLKAAEIRNSILHLQSSNAQLQRFVDEGDTDCVQAIQENREVIRRMEERVALLKSEVERRGFMWGENEDSAIGKEEVNDVGEMNGRRANGDGGETDGSLRQGGGRNEQSPRAPRRYFEADGLARQLGDRTEEDESEANGLHL